MLKRHLTAALSLLLVPCLQACVDSSDDGLDNEGPVGGKADDEEEVSGEDEESLAGACTLDDDTPREITQFVLNDHVQFRCLGPTGFVQTSCCEDAINDFVAVSDCPLQSKWNSASGSDKRCVEDTADTEGGQFVPTSCCAPLCDDGATWREQRNGTFCVTAAGTFENSMCCQMQDAARCENAAFDEFIAADGQRHCRDQKSGQFAMASCCVDSCFEEIADSREREDRVVPFECLDAVESECGDAALNAGDLCHDIDTGRFVKAACCGALAADDRSDDERRRADRAFECELVNDDVIRCQTGDDFACDRSEAFLADDDRTAECCDLERADGETFEYCF